MSEKSTEALEREAEAVRSQVANTAETLRDKMNPGEIFDEMRGYFSGSDGSLAWQNLKTQIRDNPLPLALVGAGLAWLFLGGGPSADRLRRSRHAAYYDEFDDDDYLGSPYTDEEWDGSGMDALGGLQPTTAGAHASSTGSRKSSMKDKAGALASNASDAVSRAGSRASGMAESAYGAAGDAYSRAGSAASHAASTVGHAASSVGHAASSFGHQASSAASGAASAASMAARRAAKTGRMLGRTSTRVGRTVRDGYVDILAREPLVLGAVGLAVGAAVGAALPRTRYEDEQIGPYRDRLRDEASKRVSESYEDAKEAAKSIAERTYEAAKEEADRQGLVPGSDSRSMTERVSKVAGAAASAAEKQARDKVGSAKSPSTRP